MSTATKARPSAGAGAAAAEAEAPTAKSKKKLFLVVGVVAVLAAAGAWFFLLRGSDEPKAAPEPVPGEVVTLEPISVNLAAGHYLRVGLALQLIEAPEHEAEGSKALDLAISTLSGRDAAVLSDPVQREAIKKELTDKVREAYHGDVMAVYLTEFVTQ